MSMANGFSHTMIFPAAIRSQSVHAHLYDDYWEDIGTIRAFFDANLALTRQQPPFDLAKPEAPIYSRARFLPPSQLDGATVRQSLIADGCRISNGVTIENSVIGLRCIIGENATIRNSVLMGADEYETESELADDQARGQPPIGIGAGSFIEGAIIDKNCRIGTNVRVANGGGQDERDVSEFCFIRDGISIIAKNAVLTDGWQL